MNVRLGSSTIPSPLRKTPPWILVPDTIGREIKKLCHAPPKGAVLIKAICNRLNRFKCFVVETARFCESELELVLRARRGCEGRCSGCGVRCSCYEHRRTCWSRLVWSYLSGDREDSCGERICPGYRKISRVSAIIPGTRMGFRIECAGINR